MKKLLIAVLLVANISLFGLGAVSLNNNVQPVKVADFPYPIIF